MPRPLRLHRLPQCSDYTLIPAPINLSIDTLPLVTEKSPLPAVIVTPSSPLSSTDFSIAFLPSPTKPSIRERLGLTFQLRARTAILLLFLIFTLFCHVITHRLATRRPRLEFSTPGASPATEWFSLQSLFGIAVEEKREFIITETRL